MGGVCFGNVIETKSRGIVIPAGEIRLSIGKHIGPNKGWGADHIWAEHEKEMAAKGFTGFAQVPEYVASIVHVGTPLYFDGNAIRYIRLMAVRSSTGTAILEFRNQRECAVWAIVTAYSGVRTHGTRVGTVR